MLKLLLLTIGNELITGKTLNTNTQKISELFFSEGITFDAHITLKDNEDEIVDVLNYSINRFNVVIVSGGLGPTSDDITRFAASRFFEKPLIKNELAYENLVRFYKNREMPDSNLIQTLIPEDSIPIENKVGTAAGFYHFYKNTHFYFIPGVPKEALNMLKNYIIDDIKKKFNINKANHHLNLFFGGISESALFDILSKNEKLNDFSYFSFDLGFYPSQTFIKLSLNFNENSLENILDKEKETFYFISQNLLDNIFFFSFDRKFFEKLNNSIFYEFFNFISNLNHKFKLIKQFIYSEILNDTDNDKTKFENNTFNEREYFLEIITNNQELIPGYILYKFLKKLNLTISTAESCTGGLIGSKITNISGSSFIYKGGIVAYSNEVKENILGVKRETLNNFGAVSEETVKEMAKNVKDLFKSDVSIAVSGIAGPTGSTKDKPVGLVYYCININDKEKTFKYIFPFDRLINKERFANTAIFLLISELFQNMAII